MLPYFPIIFSIAIFSLLIQFRSCIPHFIRILQSFCLRGADIEHGVRDQALLGSMFHNLGSLLLFNTGSTQCSEKIKLNNMHIY